MKLKRILIRFAIGWTTRLVRWHSRLFLALSGDHRYVAETGAMIALRNVPDATYLILSISKPTKFEPIDLKLQVEELDELVGTLLRARVQRYGAFPMLSAGPNGPTYTRH